MAAILTTICNLSLSICRLNTDLGYLDKVFDNGRCDMCHRELMILSQDIQCLNNRCSAIRLLSSSSIDYATNIDSWTSVIAKKSVANESLRPNCRQQKMKRSRWSPKTRSCRRRSSVKPKTSKLNDTTCNPGHKRCKTISRASVPCRTT